ncbi:cytochrome c [Zeaxanthinibacter enoshimensis]|uniref:c-type cytochrome n=1 Tax=Zeaxanthinibacter enoshimensis TaxID=392009 RepID=UPI0035661EB1
MKIFLPIYIFLVGAIALHLFQDKELQASMERGKEIYQDFCVTCHLPAGEGVANTFPPLAGSDYLLEKREASIRAVKFGQQGEIVVNGVTYDNMMMNMGLEDEEVADVLNYILHSWGNEGGAMVTVEEVSAVSQ